jgi:hypothetical protein
MSQIILNEMASIPDAPVSGKAAIFAKDNKIYSLNDADESNLLTQDEFGFNVVIGAGSASLSTGIKGNVTLPFDCTISSVELYADTPGAIVVDIWKSDDYASFPADDGDSITSATPPTIVATNQKSQDLVLSGWTKSFSAGTILTFNIDSVSAIKIITVFIKGKKV